MSETVDGEFRALPPGSDLPAIPVLTRGAPKRALLVPRNPDGAAYEQMVGEPTMWYMRFESYRGLGPTRTLFEAYCQYRRGQVALHGGTFTPEVHRTVPANWRRTFNYWKWKDRAQAWDAHVVDLLREQEVAKIRQANEEKLNSGKALRALGIAEVGFLHRSKRGGLKPMEAIMAVKIGNEIISEALGTDDKDGAPPDTFRVKVLEGVDYDRL